MHNWKQNIKKRESIYNAIMVNPESNECAMNYSTSPIHYQHLSSLINNSRLSSLKSL